MFAVRLSLVTILGLLFFSSGLKAQNTRSFVYWARQVPTTSKNCHEQAKDLAVRFTQVTGLAATGRCESASSKGNDLTIHYESAFPLEVVSSAPDLGFPGQGYEFNNKDQCEKEIADEIRAFKELTGNEPLLSFCQSKENYYGLVRWALVMEGFGKADTKISWASSRFPGQPSRELVQKIKSEVKAQFLNSVKVRHVFLQDDEKGQLRLTVNYFGKYGEQIKAFALAEVNTLAQCQVSLREMQEISANQPQIITLSYCVNNPYHRGADLVVILDVLRWYTLRQSAESFKSYEECHAAKPALLDTYQSHYPEKLLGGFCTEWGSFWKVNLLELPSSPKK
jgi:hypothetical protein